MHRGTILDKDGTHIRTCMDDETDMPVRLARFPPSNARTCPQHGIRHPDPYDPRNKRLHSAYIATMTVRGSSPSGIRVKDVAIASRTHFLLEMSCGYIHPGVIRNSSGTGL